MHPYRSDLEAQLAITKQQLYDMTVERDLLSQENTKLKKVNKMHLTSQGKFTIAVCILIPLLLTMACICILLANNINMLGVIAGGLVTITLTGLIGICGIHDDWDKIFKKGQLTNKANLMATIQKLKELLEYQVIYEY